MPLAAATDASVRTTHAVKGEILLLNIRGRVPAYIPSYLISP